MKPFFLLITCILLSIAKISAKPNLSYYSHNHFGLGLNIVKFGERALAAELRLGPLNTEFSNIQTEIDAYFRFKPGNYCRFSLGAGMRQTFFTEAGEGTIFLFPLNFEFFPLKNFHQLSLITELAPEVYINEEIQKLRGIAGVRYTFGKE